MGFESGKGVNIANVMGERVPEAGVRTAEGSRTHGSQTGRMTKWHNKYIYY